MQPLLAWQPATMPLLPVSASEPETDGQLMVVLTLAAGQPAESCAFR